MQPVLMFDAHVTFQSFQIDKNGRSVSGESFTTDSLHITNGYMYKYVNNLLNNLKQTLK